MVLHGFVWVSQMPTAKDAKKRQGKPGFSPGGASFDCLGRKPQVAWRPRRQAPRCMSVSSLATPRRHIRGVFVTTTLPTQILFTQKCG